MHACVKHFGSSFRQIRNCARQIRVIDQLEAAFAAPLTCRRVRSVLRIVTKAWTASADGNCRSAIRVVSRGLPSSVFTFPLRARYLPPCPQARPAALVRPSRRIETVWLPAFQATDAVSRPCRLIRLILNDTHLPLPVL